MSQVTTMTEGGIVKQIVRFSIPLILGNLFQQLYNTVDSIIVGNYIGSDALAAVGSTGALINLLLAFCIGASAGAGVVIAQYYGAQDAGRIKVAVHTTIAIACVSGAFMTAFGILFAPILLRVMGTPTEIMVQSVVYLRIYFAGILFSVIYNFAAGILNAVGYSSKSLQFLILAAGSNVVFDILFVVVFRMGVEGVALATDIAQFLSFIFIMRFMTRSKELFRVNWKDVRLDGHMAGKIIKIGLPTGIQNMMISFSNVTVQSSVNSFGATLMAAYAAYVKIDGFNILPVLSFSMAATTFTGQNVGAGKYDRVRKGKWVALALSVGYRVISSPLIILFGRQIIGIFVNDPEVISLGCYILKFFCPFYFLLATMHALAGTIRGTGKTIPPILIILVALCLFRVAWLKITLPMFGDMKWIFLVYPLSWALGAAMMALYTWKGNWRPYRKEQ